MRRARYDEAVKTGWTQAALDHLRLNVKDPLIGQLTKDVTVEGLINCYLENELPRTSFHNGRLLTRG
jgi:hypothetical protein